MIQAKETRMDSQDTDALLSDGIGKVNLALQETFKVIILIIMDWIYIL